ncbi:competence type IV pilus major pilin ComGC [Sediminibacillus albus]|uniref:ComG operon protein 3 n=1 Tax=Sediminibacillus albus TaxID=407036 RepID=A0A1G9CTY2_9BACI|nr:competence type IV pilus major pilin ComGC [Sediminibacillus albus]SDK55161.1 competence protein ComGC [Sediminibacillus albus]
MKNDKGFTLIEMLIVLTIISVLLILILPNLSDKNEDVQSKGCTALVEMAASQVQAYQIDNGIEPDSIDKLLEDNYLKTDTCANGSKQLQLSPTGEVTLVSVQ